MVWFQCEDCGENLKKPKLTNHFRICSAYKLSCIDCGEMFNQESVQSHNQCITEAEKYGPKGQGNASHNGHIKTEKPKKNSDVDINVGLSSRPPWFCSLCKTQATSKQTLLLHADGKKHRAKARAFHASQKQTNQTEKQTPIVEAISDGQKVDLIEANGSDKIVHEIDTKKDTNGTEKENKTKKRKVDANDKQKNDSNLTNGEVIQAEQSEASEHKSKKKKGVDETMKDHPDNKEASDGKIKWKKLITSTLKSSDGVIKIKKLQKIVVKALKESGANYDEKQLRDKLMDKINSSTRFIIENKRVRLVSKSEES